MIQSQASPLFLSRRLEPCRIKPKPDWPNASWTSWAMVWKSGCQAPWSTARDEERSKLSGASQSMTRADRSKRFQSCILNRCSSSRTLFEVREKSRCILKHTFVYLCCWCDVVLYHSFPAGILEFIGGKDCPPCSLFFCLGEKWPDPDSRPWDKKLITVEVKTLELFKCSESGVFSHNLKQYFFFFSALTSMKCHDCLNCPLKRAVDRGPF